MITVCIPTYNRSHYLQYAVNSVLRQTYTDFELIICDDGSTDDTPEIVSKFNDSRIHYLRHPQNIGRSRNMKSGFLAAKGEYFVKFDDDDGLTPEFLEKTVNILNKFSEIDFVCTNHWVINSKGEKEIIATEENAKKWGKTNLKLGVIPNLLEETFIKQSLQVGSTLFRFKCLQEVDYMRAEADGCEDFDLLVRLAMAGKTGYFIPELLMEYRFHGGQTSLKQNLHFLKAKTFCINSYQFSDSELEKARINKLAITEQALALRLIENNETDLGRELLLKSAQVLGKSNKVKLGIFLSYLPLKLRQIALQIFRNIRSQDYSEKVRGN
jgi:glycosyltransferase involved in cell wall biosynthesis